MSGSRTRCRRSWISTMRRRRSVSRTGSRSRPCSGRSWMPSGSGTRVIPSGRYGNCAPRLGRSSGSPRCCGTVLPDPLFLHDAQQWLDATELWGSALRHGLAALTAEESGDADAAAKSLAAMDEAAGRASAIQVDPAEHHQHGPVKIADPFLEEFVEGVRGEGLALRGPPRAGGAVSLARRSAADLSPPTRPFTRSARGERDLPAQPTSIAPQRGRAGGRPVRPCPSACVRVRPRPAPLAVAPVGAGVPQGGTGAAQRRLPGTGFTGRRARGRSGALW